MVAGTIFLTNGCGVSESDICETARQLMSEQCARMNSENPATCVSVTLKKKVSDDCWTADAKLDNGTVIPITIKVHDNDMLEIDFSSWQSKQMEKEFDEMGKQMEKEFDNL